MSRTSWRRLLLSALLLLAACSAPAGAGITTAPGIHVWLDQPIDGIVLSSGSYRLKAHARAGSGSGVESIAFLVNSAPAGSVQTDASRPLVQAELDWTPPAPGEYLIQAEASNGAGAVRSAAARICVGADLQRRPGGGPGCIPATPLQPSQTSVAQLEPAETPAATETTTSTPQPTDTAQPPTETLQPPTSTPQPPTSTPQRPTATVASPTTAPQPSTNTPTASITPTPRDTQPPAIGSLTAEPTTIYYGQCTREPTVARVVLTASDPSGIASATLRYGYRGSSGAFSERAMPMAPAGGGSFTASINAGAEAFEALRGEDGRIEYWAEVTDNAGNTGRTAVPAGALALFYCAPPTVTPTLTPTPADSQPPTFQRLTARPNPAGYFDCGGGDVVEVITTIHDDSPITSVTLIYYFQSNNPEVGRGPTRILAMTGGQGSYTGAIDIGKEGAGDLKGTFGDLIYYIVAVDAYGNEARSATQSVRIQKGPC